MPKLKTLRVLGLAVLLAASGAAIFAADPTPAPTTRGLMGVAKPVEERTISYERPGRIVELKVKENDVVKATDVLAELNAEEEKWALKIDEMKATSEVSINAEKAVRKQKQADLERMKTVAASVSKQELYAAELEVTVAEARIAMAEQQQKEDGLKLNQDRESFRKSQLTSPIDGVVAKIFLKVGESAEGGNLKAMTIIQLDPLLVEVPVPLAQAQKLKPGDMATIRFIHDPKDVRQGKVRDIAVQVDTGSQRLLVRVEVPNPQKSQANALVDVEFNSDRVAQK